MSFNKNNCKLSLPYPKINIKETNLYYAKILLKNHSGIHSEFTSVSQYLYHHFVTLKDYKEVSDILLKISMVEMEHLKIIGTIIMSLGGDPSYSYDKKHKHKFWNAKFIDYEKDPESIIKSNIESEKNSIFQYERSIKLINNENITSILKRIILDEHLHIKILTGIYDNYFS